MNNFCYLSEAWRDNPISSLLKSYTHTGANIPRNMQQENYKQETLNYILFSLNILNMLLLTLIIVFVIKL